MTTDTLDYGESIDFQPNAPTSFPDPAGDPPVDRPDPGRAAIRTAY